MKALAFALRALRRDWRAGELRVLAAALVVAVASITAVGFFTDRAREGMNQQAGELLAADLVVSSRSPIPSERAAAAQRLGLATAQTVSFLSVILAGDQPVMAEIKAVGPGYPLRGQLRTAQQPFGQDRPEDGIPAPGEAWLDSRLMGALDLAAGDTLTLGKMRLAATRVLSYEPDRGGDLFNIAPRLLMHVDDLPRTGLLLPGSRVEYRLLVAGDAGAVGVFRSDVEEALSNARIQGVRDARPELRAALDRAEQFLGLAALVAAVLAGVAIATAARRYAARHLDTTAILRCFGATQRFVVRVFVLQLLLLALVASLAGCIAGYLAQQVLVALLASLVATGLPAPSFTPVLVGLASGVILLLGFALPPLARLKRVPPLRVIRRDLGPVPAGAISVYGSAVVAVAALLAWHIADPALTLWVLAGLAGTLSLLAGLAYALVVLLSRLRERAGAAWRFGIAAVARRRQASVAQVAAFGAGIMVLLLLSLVRADLLEGWRRTLPPDAPNHFLINIQPDQVAALRAFFGARGVAVPGLHPMVRGRLVAVNGKPVAPEDYAEPRARRLVAREFNLSWTADLHPRNRVVAGRWWHTEESGEPLLSVEQGLAETLGLGLGDVLTYRVGAEELNARIVNLRAVDWDSFQVNFFVVTPPGVLESYPATYITSFHLPPGDAPLLADLVREFPSVTVIDVAALMAKVREVMDRVASAVEFVFVFSLLAGLVVLHSAIQATQDERKREGAILRTLGASRRQLLLGLLTEFVIIGLLAGLVAALAASATGYVLATQVFHFSYHLNPWIWLIGLAGGAVGVGLAGILGARPVLRHPPLQVLRQV